MTTMTPRSRIPVLSTALALLLGSVLVASANLVTYQVNMSAQIALGNFNPGAGHTVLVAGNFSNPDWLTTNVLTASIADPNIYEGTFNNDRNNPLFVNYKFIINSGVLNWESIPDRFFPAATGNQTNAVVYFNNITNVNTIVITQVTFSVNIGVQDALNNFDPATDFVYVAGDVFNNNWNAGAQVLTNSVVDTNVWQGTFNLTNTVGAAVNYKFVMNTFANGLIWESNGVGPNNANDRQFTFTNQATSLPVVFFNNITNSTSLVTTQITFKVNLAAQIARGTFDPNVGTVSVAGDAINNWSPTTSGLSPAATNASLWSGTFTLTNTVGGPVNYKFVLNNGGTWEDNGVGPNGADNRQLIFTNVATALPDVYFNNLGNLGAVTVNPPVGGQVAVSWTGGPLIRLQTNSTLTGVWGDVPGSTGLSTMNFGAGASAAHFRLIGPW